TRGDADPCRPGGAHARRRPPRLVDRPDPAPSPLQDARRSTRADDHDRGTAVRLYRGGDGSPQRRVGGPVKRVMRIAGSLVLAGLIAWRLDVRSIGHALAEVSWGWWLAALGCYVVAQVVSAVRWRDLSRPLGFTPSLGTHVGYLFAGNFFNLVLPTSVG